jgi:hypothetical protein
MTSTASVAEPPRPHLIFVRKDCEFSNLFVRSIRGTDVERFFSIIDVQEQPVDPKKVHSVPTIVVNHNTMYVGRDAFAWLLNELKHAIKPMACAYVGAVPAPLDGGDVDAFLAPMASSNFTDAEPMTLPANKTIDESEPIDARLARMKQERA